MSRRRARSLLTLRGLRPRTHGSLRTRNWEILGSPAEDGTAGPHRKGKSRNPVMHDAKFEDGSVVSKKSPNKGGSPSVKGWRKGSQPGNANQPESRAGHRAGEACQAGWSACEAARRTGRRVHGAVSPPHACATAVVPVALSLERQPRWNGVTWVCSMANGWRKTSKTCTRGCIEERTEHSPAESIHPKARRAAKATWIMVLEDKLVQRAVVEVMMQSTKWTFSGSRMDSGGRSAHMALDALSVGITRRAVNCVRHRTSRDFWNHRSRVDDEVCRAPDSGSWMLRLIEMDQGRVLQRSWTETTEGVPQGRRSRACWRTSICTMSSISGPSGGERHARGQVIAVRYADDVALGFRARRGSSQMLERAG